MPPSVFVGSSPLSRIYVGGVLVEDFAQDTVVFTRQIATDSDDAEERTDTGAVALTSTDLELLFDVAAQVVGLRFPNVTIPSGSTIVGADIQFSTDISETPNAGSPTFTIRGVAADDPPTFTTATNNVTSRATTTASASWSPPEWTIADERGAAQRTSDLSAVVQELIDRPGRPADGALAFIITGTQSASHRRTAHAFMAGAPQHAPALVVEYLEPAAPPLLQTGLLAEHRFSDGSGQVITDHSGNNSHAQLGSTSGADATDPAWNASGWLTSDGVDDFAAIDTGQAVTTGSFSVLVRPNFAIDGSALRRAMVLGGQQMKVNLDHPNPDFAQVIEIRRASDSAFLAASFGTITQGTWVVVSGVFDGVNLKAYKNGVLQDTTPVNGQTSTSQSIINYFSGVDATNQDVKHTFGACSIAYGIIRGHMMTDQEVADEYAYIRSQVAARGISLPEFGGEPPPPPPPPDEPVLFVRQITAASDDAEERTDTGAVNLTSTDLELLYDSGSSTAQIVGVRFPSVMVPANAQIVSSYIQFSTEDPAESAGSPTFIIQGHLSANAPTFGTATNSISGRTRTVNSVSWSPPAWTVADEREPDQRTADLSPIVQELVNQSAPWVPGGGMAFIFTDGGGGGDSGTPASRNMNDLLLAVGVTHESPSLPSNKSWPTTFRTPEQHGAVGNGSTNDIAAINACLEFAKTNGMGVRFGTNKTYLCNGKISGSATNGWNSMLWEGNGSTLFVGTGASATSGNPFILLQNCTGVRVYGLKIDGNRAQRGNDPSSDLFSGHNWQVSSCHDAAWFGCESSNAVTDGWRIAGITASVSQANIPTWNALINCVADNCVRLGASLIQGIDTYIVGPNSQYKNTNTRAPAAGIDIEPTHHYDSTGTSVNRCIINGPTFSGNRHDGIHIANLGTVTMRNIKIRNCIIENNSGRNLAGSSPSQAHAPLYIGPPVIGGEVTNCSIRNNTGQQVGSLVRGTALYLAPGADDDANYSWVINGNRFSGNTAFVSGETQGGGTNIGGHASLNGSRCTITGNLVDIRNTGRGGVNVPGSSPSGNTVWRKSSDGVAFAQNAGGNTTNTVTHDNQVFEDPLGGGSGGGGSGPTSRRTAHSSASATHAPALVVQYIGEDIGTGWTGAAVDDSYDVTAGSGVNVLPVQENDTGLDGTETTQLMSGAATVNVDGKRLNYTAPSTEGSTNLTYRLSHPGSGQVSNTANVAVATVAAGGGGGGVGFPANNNMGTIVNWAGISLVPGSSLPSNRSWPTSFRTPEQHGAVGNGTTNDAPAINACLAHAKSNGLGVRFGAGKIYRMDDKFNSSTLSGWNNVLWEGNGATIRIGPGVTALSGTGTCQFMNCRGVRIYDLTLDGRRATRHAVSNDYFGGHNFSMLSCHDVAFIRVGSHRAMTDGWRIAATASLGVTLANIPTWNVLIDCEAFDNVRLGVGIIQGQDLYVKRGRYNDHKVRAPTAGIDIEPTEAFDPTGVSVRRWQVDSVEFSDNYKFGFVLANLGDVPLRDGWLQNCIIQRNGGRHPLNGAQGSHAPHYFNHQQGNTNIINNTIRDNTHFDDFTRACGIFLNIGAGRKKDGTIGVGNVTISGNKFSGNSAKLITSTGQIVPATTIFAHPGHHMTTMTITNNLMDIRNTGNHGVNIQPGQVPVNLTVTGNTVWRKSSDGVAFAQNPGANTTNTVTHDNPVW